MQNRYLGDVNVLLPDIIKDNKYDLVFIDGPKSKYLAYFQNHTNTYAPVDVLRDKFYEARRSINHSSG